MDALGSFPLGVFSVDTYKCDENGFPDTTDDQEGCTSQLFMSACADSDYQWRAHLHRGCSPHIIAPATPAPWIAGTWFRWTSSPKRAALGSSHRFRHPSPPLLRLLPPLSSTVRRLLSPSQDALLEPPMLRAPRGRVRARSARPAVRGERRVPRVHGLPPLRRVWVLHGRAAHVLRAHGRRAWLGCGAARAVRSGRLRRKGARGRGPGREKGRRNRSLCEIAQATAAARGAGS